MLGRKHSRRVDALVGKEGLGRGDVGGKVRQETGRPNGGLMIDVCTRLLMRRCGRDVRMMDDDVEGEPLDLERETLIAFMRL